jgi:predicted transcriptional regulator
MIIQHFFQILVFILYIVQYVVSGDTALSDKAILKSILKNKQMSFQDIFLECFTNRNMARKRLNALIEEGLIQQDPNWRKGQALIITLTPKGEIECLKNEVDRIEKSIEIVDSVFERLEEIGFDKFREALRERSPTIHVSGPYGGDVPVDVDTNADKIEIRDALRELEQAFANFQMRLHTQTGGSTT